MKFLKRHFEEHKKEKAIDKKLKKVQENKTIASDKEKLLDLGLSEEEAEFKARKNLKKANRKKKVDSIVSGARGAVDVLSMEMGVNEAPKRKSTGSKGKKKSSSRKGSDSKNKKKGGGGGSNPLHMDLPDFKL